MLLTPALAIHGRLAVELGWRDALTYDEAALTRLEFKKRNARPFRRALVRALPCDCTSLKKTGRCKLLCLVRNCVRYLPLRVTAQSRWATTPSTEIR